MEKGFWKLEKFRVVFGRKSRFFIVYKYNILYDEYMYVCVGNDSDINVIAKI